MSDTLAYDLTVKTSKAEQQADKFAKKVQKQLNSVPVDVDTRKAEAKVQRLAKLTYAFQTRMQREQEKADKAAEKAAIARGKIWEKAANDRRRAEERSIKAAERLAMLAEKEAKTKARATERQARADAKPHQDRLKLEQDFVHRANLIAVQYNMQNESLVRDHQARINNIVKQGAAMRLVDVRRSLDIENALFARAAQQQAQQKQRYTLFGTSFSNKTNQNMFMVQQAIEDFSYAGIRGASNNLAMMASTMGGPGGLIALGTVLGVTVLPTLAKATGLVGDEFGSNKKQLDAFTRSMERASSLRGVRFDTKEGVKLGQSRAEMQAEVDAGNRRQTFLTGEIRNLSEKKRLLEEFVSLNRSLYFYENSEDKLPFGAAGQEAAGQRRRQQQVIQQLMGLGMSAEDITNYNTGMFGFGARFGVGSSLDGMQSGIDENQKELGNSKATTQILEARLNWLDKINKAYSKLVDMEKSELPELDESLRKNQNITKQYDKRVDGLEKSYDKRRKVVEDELEAQLESLAIQREHATDRKTIAEIEKQAAEAIKEAENTIRKMGLSTLEQANSANAIAEAWAKTSNKVEESIDSVEKQIDAERRLVSQIEDRIKALDKAREAQKNSFMGDNFDMERSIERKKAEEAKKALGKQAEQGLEAALQQNEAAFLPQIRMIERLQYLSQGAKGEGAQHYKAMLGRRKQLLSQGMQGRAEQLRAYFERQHTAGQAGIDQRLQGVEAKKQMEHERLISGRADQLGKSGDLEGQRDALQELYGMQKQQASQAQTSGQMKQSMDRAVETQTKLNAVMDQMRAKEETALKASQDRLVKNEELLASFNAQKITLQNIKIFEQDEAALQRMMQQLTALGEKLNGLRQQAIGAGIDLGTLGATVGVPQAPVQAPKPGNAGVVSSTTNNYSVSVAGLPGRPSLTAREMAQMAARQAKVASQRSGMA